MKTIALVLILAAGSLSGCTVGPIGSRVVIGTGEPQPGDADYTRAMALRQNEAYRMRTAIAEARR